MGIVRRHKRVTVSGRVVTVRQHTRDYDSGPDGNERRPAAEDAAPAPNAAALPPPEPRENDETWWDDSEAPREPWMDSTGDEVEHEGHTFKVNRVPAYRPQGDYNFADPEPELTERERWERDMKADAERRGLPAYRPVGTKASWWKKRG